MTGTSKAFTVGVYLAVAVAALLVGSAVTPLLGVVFGLVFLVLAVRAAWA